MIIKVQISKRINYGIQCELDSEAGQAVVDYFADAKKRTLYAQSVSGHAMEVFLSENLDAIRDALDAERHRWSKGSCTIEVGQAQAVLPGLETSRTAEQGPVPIPARAPAPGSSAGRMVLRKKVRAMHPRRRIIAWN